MYPRKVKLSKGLIATPHHALVHEKTRIGIVSDLHVGFEEQQVAAGTFVPRKQLRGIKEKLYALKNEFGVKTIILNGDVKHSFGRATYRGERELGELFKFLLKTFSKVIVLKGNHDNFLQNTLQKFPSIEFHEHFLELPRIVVTHGDKAVPPEILKGKALVMGHQHPSIVLRDEVGASMKLPAFLYKAGKNPVIITPALSPLSAGTDFLTPKASGFLGKTLEREGVESFTPIGVSEEGLVKLPKLGILQRKLGKALYFESE